MTQLYLFRDAMISARAKRILAAALLAGIVWLAPVTAMAQEAESQGSQKNYVLAYVLVGFIVTLAMLVVCRSAGMLDRPKMIAEELKHKLEKLTGKE
jgi:hypothetical protein